MPEAVLGEPQEVRRLPRVHDLSRRIVSDVLDEPGDSLEDLRSLGVGDSVFFHERNLTLTRITGALPYRVLEAVPEPRGWSRPSPAGDYRGI